MATQDAQGPTQGGAGHGRRAVAALIEVWQTDAHKSAYRAASESLVEHGTDALPALFSALQDAREAVRTGAIRTLGRIGDPSALIPVLNTLDWRGEGKGKSEGDAARKALQRIAVQLKKTVYKLDEKDPRYAINNTIQECTIFIVRAMCCSSVVSLVQLLAAVTRTPPWQVKCDALRELCILSETPPWDELLHHINYDRPHEQAVIGIGDLKNPAVLAAITDVMTCEDITARCLAEKLLKKYGSYDTVQILHSKKRQKGELIEGEITDIISHIQLRLLDETVLGPSTATATGGDDQPPVTPAAAGSGRFAGQLTHRIRVMVRRLKLVETLLVWPPDREPAHDDIAGRMIEDGVKTSRRTVDNDLKVLQAPFGGKRILIAPDQGKASRFTAEATELLSAIRASLVEWLRAANEINERKE